MNDRERQLDIALGILPQELEALREGDLERAHELAHARGEALLLAGGEAEEPQAESVLRKLQRLKVEHAALASEATRIRERVREDLLRLRSERQRLGGYKEARKVTPLSSRFIDKQG
jgi:hypothetical protein